MHHKGTSVVDRFFKPGSKNYAAKIGIFTLAMLPVLVLTVFGYQSLSTELTHSAYERRQALAQLAGQNVEQHFNTLVQVGVSLASRQSLITEIEKGDWQAAVDVLSATPKQFPYIERIALNDPGGTARANFPKAPGLGTNFAYRDWYQGVTRNWTPYISEVFQRVVEPKTNVIGVAIPIFAADGKHLGILLMQVELSTLLNWTHEVPVGGSGYIFVVDRLGHAMSHPTYETSDTIVDLSGLPAVKAALTSASGVGIFYNPVEKEDRLYSYWTSPNHGFSVGIQEPVSSAFSTRNRILYQVLLVYGIVLILNFFLAWLLWRQILSLVVLHQKEKIYLASMGDAIVAIDRDWKITLWNQTASLLTGWSEDEAIGRPFRSLVKFINEHDRKENVDFIEKTFLYGKVEHLSMNTVLLTRTNKEIPVSDSAAPIFDNSNVVTGVIIVFRDATNERDSGILRTDLAYASHQMRTPITKALWSLEAAAEHSKNDVHEKIVSAQHALLDVRKLSERLLEVSQIDQRTMFPKPQSVSVEGLFRDAINTCESEAKARGITVKLHGTPQAAMIETDTKMLRRALEEVLLNAIYYSPYGSDVEVQATLTPEEAHIEVRDNGIGIPEEQQALVFTKFFRGQNVPENVSGAGLGLFIAREYVRLLNGRLWFTSELGHGTTFYITIPIP